MNMKRKLICGLLCLSMVLSLAACGGSKEDTSNSADTFVYVPTYTQMSQNFENGIYTTVYNNGWFYFLSETLVDNNGKVISNSASGTDVVAYASDEAVDGEDVAEEAEEAEEYYQTWETRLYKMDMDGKVTHMSGYQQETLPDGVEGYVNVQGIDADADGNVYLLVVKSIYSFDLPEGFDENTQSKWDYYTGSTNTYQIMKLGPDGAVAGEADLTGLNLTENDYVQYMVYQDGYYYIALDSRVVVIDETGALVYTYESDSGWINSLLKLSDGKVCATIWNDSYQLICIDPVAKTADVYCEKLPDSAWNLTTGSGDYDAFYTNGANLYGVKIADGVATDEKVLNWINCDIDSDYVRTFAAISDGVIVALTQDYSSNTPVVELVTLTRTPAKDVAQKETLTLGTQYLDWDTKRQVLKFNKTNPDYRIEIKDYSEYNTDENYDAGVQKLTTEILSGDMPDIIYTSGLPIEQMEAKGLLTDLYPFMETDSEIKKDGIMPVIRNALEMDGKMYRTCATFSVMTVMGNRDVVGDTPGWTVDDLKAAYAKMPDGCTIFSEGVTRSDILQYMLMLDEDTFVDWAASECNFDSQAFIDLLEFVKMFPSEFDWENYDYGEYESDQTRIANGKQMLMMTYLSDFWDIQYNMSAFQDKGVFIGFPTSEGVGNVLSLNDGYAISSKCKAPEAAWEFVRYFMTEDYMNTYGSGFSSNQKIFDAQMKEAMTPQYETDMNGNYVLDENGNKIEISQGSWSDGVNDYEFYAMTQEQADQLLDLIASCTKVMNYNTSLFDIVNEEVQGYFNDQKSAEETAKMVQSRVSLYVKEQA